MLDTQKKNWFKIKTNLAPLPRRGHTINNIYLDGKACLLFFGGYSSENITTSNTLFTCSVEDLWNYYNVCQKIVNKGDNPLDYFNDINNNNNNNNTKKILKPVNLEYDLLPIVFRTIQTKGCPPPPRHRHSATMITYPFIPTQLQSYSSFYPFQRDIITSSSSSTTSLSSTTSPLSQYLVIIGGLDAHSHIPLNDVYILDVNNLTWCTLSKKGLKPCPPLTSKTSSLVNSAYITGEGPTQGIFGHCTIGPIKYNHLINKEREKDREKDKDDKDDYNNNIEKLPGNLTEYEILVFGGSSHAQNYRSRCYSSLFSFSLKTGEWSKVNVGHSFPSSRLSHTSSFLSHYSPLNPMRPRSVSTGLINEESDIKMPTSSQNQSCAIIFGGIGATPVGGETWALSLDYKSSGVDQYDDSASHRVTRRLSLTSETDEEIYMINEGDLLLNSARSTTNFNVTMNSLSGTNNSMNSNKIMSHNNNKYLLKSSSSVPLLNTTKQLSPSSSSLHQTNMFDNTINNATGNIGGDQDGIAFKSIKSSRPFSASSKSRGGTSKSFDFLDETEQADLNSALLKVKKERALTELQLKEEKEKVLLLENDLNEIKNNFLIEKNNYIENINENNKEIKELKEALAAALSREQQLKDLNREAYLILSLQGLAPPSNPLI